MTIKIILLAIGILTLSSLCMAADNSIKSVLGVPFGQICSIKAEFIDKPNDYYSQNINKAGYYLRIIAIDNKKLKKTLIIEPVYSNISPQKNRIYDLKAYETVSSEGVPKYWSDEVQQFDYHVRHKIVIKQQR
jgi:hypothetical protein